jgi:hypothetical protein
MSSSVTIPVEGGGNYFQGPLSQTTDNKGSFFLYQDPCCNACPSPAATCSSGTCGTTTPVLRQKNPTTKLGSVNMESMLGSGCTSGPTVSNCSPCIDIKRTTENIQAQFEATAVPQIDEGTADLVFCQAYSRKGHYLNYNSAGEAVYNIPTRNFLPATYEKALNGFLPCTFDEHVYDGYCGGGCGNCGNKSCGGCGVGNKPCKYKRSHFLIGLEQARTDAELVVSDFSLSANGVRNRTIYVTRGKRYYFTFQPCCLAINPQTGFPLATSEGGVTLSCDNIPSVFNDVSLIFTSQTNINIRGPFTGQRTPMTNTGPIRLFDTQWLFIGEHFPKFFYIAVGKFSTQIPQNGGPRPDPATSLQENLAGALIPVIVEDPNATSITVQPAFGP